MRVSLRILITVSILVLSNGLMSFNTIRKSTVTFTSTDGLIITADKYISSEDNPYIILLHEQNSSRGEFNDIARRLCKMDYNCLAVDLRNGGYANAISNETAKRCRNIKCSGNYTDVEGDMIASINYANMLSNKPVVLFGSGANGSLGMKLGKSNELVRAIIAFSPGEYFLPELSIEDTIAGLSKPLFIASSVAEASYVEQLVSTIDEESMTIFQPQSGQGARGSESLDTQNENNSEYWLALLLFFKELI